MNRGVEGAAQRIMTNNRSTTRLIDARSRLNGALIILFEDNNLLKTIN